MKSRQQLRKKLQTRLAADLWHLVDGQRSDVVQIAREGLVLGRIVDPGPWKVFAQERCSSLGVSGSPKSTEVLCGIELAAAIGGIYLG